MLEEINAKNFLSSVSHHKLQEN